jgi:hypothetical protein
MIFLIIPVIGDHKDPKRFKHRRGMVLHGSAQFDDFTLGLAASGRFPG